MHRDNMMRKYYYYYRAIMPLLMLALLSSGVAAISESECKKERRLGMIACKPLAYGYLPSPECCERIRNTHPECVCPLITPEVAAQIDVPSALKIAEACGKKISLPFECGSLVIPSKWSPLDRLRTLFSNKRWFLIRSAPHNNDEVVCMISKMISELGSMD